MRIPIYSDIQFFVNHTSNIEAINKNSHHIYSSTQNAEDGQTSA